MSTELTREYSGELACCGVCGWSDASTEYVPSVAGGTRAALFNHTGDQMPDHQFLKRTCNRCGYEWGELVLPQPEAEPVGVVTWAKAQTEADGRYRCDWLRCGRSFNDSRDALNHEVYWHSQDD